jgi:hypothetical protein
MPPRAFLGDSAPRFDCDFGIPSNTSRIVRLFRRTIGHLPRRPIARAALDDAIPLLTGDPMSTAKAFVQEAPEREQIEGLSDGQLLRRAARELLVAVCVIAKVIANRAASITKPAELGSLMRALGDCFQAAHAALGQFGLSQPHRQ